MNGTRAYVLLLGVWAAWAGSAPASAQDVEMLGARYGTRPPAAYYQELARNPDAYRFTRGRASRIRPVGSAPSAPGGAGAAAGPLAALGPRDGPVVGSFAIPVLLGLFTDSPAGGPFTREAVTEAYFADAPGTVKAYYGEISGGRVSLDGAVEGWHTVALTRSQVTRNDGGLSGSSSGGGGIGNFIYQTVQQVITTRPDFDWGRFDNDGPDGIPNSGDDDGWVDALAVVHPTKGAECDGNVTNIWSHKWSLSQALRGVTIQTPTPRPGGGTVGVDDYFVAPAVSCDPVGGQPALNEIGIFTHEVGHAFGLPDLYDVRSFGSHAGVGTWDLMASGAWGCDNRTPSSPCHMGAWSKAMLGWVDVVTLAPGIDHGVLAIDPVERSHEVYRIDAQNGSGEYFLLEHRYADPGTFDARLLGGGGLLVWQVDPVRVAARWGSNTVNGSEQPGVRLRQADGRNDLLRPGGGRGDAGDPFPGTTDNRFFHAGSNPASDSWSGAPTGLTVLDINRSGSTLGMHLLTRSSTVTLVAQGSSGTAPLFTVDGQTPRPSGGTFTAAPFSNRSVEAAGGEPLEPGVRRPFSRWADGLAARTRNLRVPLGDTTLTALYQGRELLLGVTLSGGSNGIVPATVRSFPASPDLWYPEGQEVEVEVVPRTGFSFLDWSGDLAGATNPTFVTLSAPIFAGAALESIYEVPDVDFTTEATVPVDLELAVANGTAPVVWEVVSGTLPEGLVLRSGGRLTGAAREPGTFGVTVRGRDAVGLFAEGRLTVEVVPPSIPPARAARHFLLAGAALSDAEQAYLDRQGNGNGRYDLGDFRIWVTGAVGP